MEKSRKIIDIVFKTISKLRDEEIESIINKEGKLIYIKKEKDIKNNEQKNEDKNILNICYELDKISSREEAYKILKRKTIKKDDVINIANHYNIKILKSHTKAKIIDNIVEGVVGFKEDKEAIKNIDIK